MSASGVVAYAHPMLAQIRCRRWPGKSADGMLQTVASSVLPACRRGRALIGLKRFGAAEEALERSLALSPGDAGAQQVGRSARACGSDIP